MQQISVTSPRVELGQYQAKARVRKGSLQLFVHSISGVVVMIEGFTVVVSAAAVKASKAERARMLNFMLSESVFRDENLLVRSDSVLKKRVAEM